MLYSDSAKKLSRNTYELLIFMTLIIILVLTVGAIGYKILFDLSILDSYYYSVLTATSINAYPAIKTKGQKIFVGIYAMLSIILFVALISSIVAYLTTNYFRHYLK